MSRITTYVNDTAVTATDKVLGTDGLDNSTKNFTVGALQTFILQGNVFNSAQIPEDRYILGGDSDIARQGILYEEVSVMANVAIPAAPTDGSYGFVFNVGRDGVGILITLTGYGSTTAFPYDVQSFIGKGWTSSDYTGAGGQVITGFDTIPFTISTSNPNEVTWRFRGTISALLPTEAIVGPGRVLTTVVITSLNRRNLVIGNGAVVAADDTAAAALGVPINGIYRTGSDLKIRVA